MSILIQYLQNNFFKGRGVKMLQDTKKVFINANITTLCEELPYAEAVCVSNGRIETIGTNAEIQSYVSTVPHEIIDCQGKYLYPGFIDSHSHLTMYSKLLDQVCCSSPCKTIDDVLSLLKEKAKNTPKGQWIIGYSYDDSGLKENRHLNRNDLDSVSTEHPIFVFHISSHMGYVNSLSIQKLAITNESTIEGGEYAKDEQGELTGFLIEYAFFECQKVLPTPSPEQMHSNFKKAIANYNKCGITTFFDGGVGFGGTAPECVNALLALDRKNELNARAYMQFLSDDMEIIQKYGLYDFGSDYVKFGGLKYFVDGSIQVFTAALLEDYHTRQGHKGELLFSIDAIESIIEKYHCMNVQIAIHTNGDAASEAVIQAFEKALVKNPRTDLHHMLIHAQMVSDTHLERMQKCGIVPSFFSSHVEIWGDRHATIFLGPERVARLNPAGSAARLGMPFGLHVDTPVLPVTVLGNMHAAVNRISSSGKVYGEDQRITPLQALEAYTIHSALCCNTRADRGSLAVGNYADFVILDKNLLTENTQEIKSINVLKTICGGRIVYDAAHSEN